jgi:hypothetical protein
MLALHVAIGVALGAVGAAAHLALTWWRARLVTSGRSGLAWATLPLGLGAVGLALLVAAKLAPEAAWAFVVGLLVTRFAVLHRARTPRQAGDRGPVERNEPGFRSDVRRKRRRIADERPGGRRGRTAGGPTGAVPPQRPRAGR